MSAQKGILILIKVGNGGTPTETFTTVGGMRSSRITLGNRAVPADTLESGAWRRLTSNMSIRTLTISGNGIFTDAASEETVRGYAFGGTVNNYQFYFANGDYVQGAFLITNYERGGNYNGEETYSLSLASAGNISFTGV